MNTIYYCECDSNDNYGMELVYYLNTKFMATFEKRKNAIEWLVNRGRFLKKDWCKNDVKRIRKHNKKYGLNTTITFDCYKFIVDDDFDINEDNVWDNDYDHELIDSRYFVGRY